MTPISVCFSRPGPPLPTPFPPSPSPSTNTSRHQQSVAIFWLKARKMEPPTKLRKLNDVRRSLPHCSASALAAIVNAVREGGLPQGRLHRNDIRKARDYENKQLDTKFGPILQSVQVKGVNGNNIMIMKIIIMMMINQTKIIIMRYYYNI